MRAHPGDGAGQTFAQFHLGRPAQNPAGFGVVRQQADNLALFGAQAFFIHHDARPAARERHNFLAQFPDADFVTGAEIKGLAINSGGFGGFDERRHGIIQIGEIPEGVQVAKMDFFRLERLGDDGRDNCPRGLTRPIGVERTDGDGGDAERAVVAFHQFIRADFAGGVGRLPLQRVLLINRHAQGAAVDFTGRRVD